MKQNLKLPLYFLSLLWWVAFAFYVIGVVLDFLALAFIPSTVSLPIGSFGIVVSAICSHFLLFERFTITDLIGTIMIVTGAWFCVVFTTKEVETLTIDRVIEKFTDSYNTPLQFFLFLTVAWFIITILSLFIKNSFIYALVPGLTGSFTIMLGGITG